MDLTKDQIERLYANGNLSDVAYQKLLADNLVTPAPNAPLPPAVERAIATPSVEEIPAMQNYQGFGSGIYNWINDLVRSSQAERAQRLQELQQPELEAIPPQYQVEPQTFAPRLPNPLPPPAAPVVPNSATDAAFKKMKDAVQEGADIGAAKASEEASYQKLLREKLQQLDAENKARQADRDAKVRGAFQKLEEFNASVAGQRVDQNRYWGAKSTGDKVFTLIGLALGSFGEGSVNQSAKMINDAIGRDIDVQKSNILLGHDEASKRKGIFDEMRSIFKDEQAADLASKVSYLELAKQNVDEISKRYSAAQIKANANYLIGDLEKQQAEAKDKLMKLLHNGMIPDFNTPPMMIQNEKLRRRWVPGLGPALDEKAAEKIREAYPVYQAMKAAFKTIAQIKEQRRFGSSTLPFTDAAASAKAQAEILKTGIGHLKGYGVLQKSDLERLDKLIPEDPAAFFSVSQDAALKAAESDIDNIWKSTLKINGLQEIEDRVGFKKKGE